MNRAAPSTESSPTAEWVMVPREPTHEMEWEAAQSHLPKANMARICYRTMLAHAPAPPPHSQDGDEAQMLRLIDQRDDAEESLSQAYYLVVGRSPEWSNHFGHDEALEEIKDTCDVLRQVTKQPSPSSSIGKELVEALRGMLDIAETWAVVTDRKYVQPENSEACQRAAAAPRQSRRVEMSDFDKMAEQFTAAMKCAANWKHGCYGAAYATRIKAAIADAKAAIAVAERHPEIAPSSPPVKDMGRIMDHRPNCELLTVPTHGLCTCDFDERMQMKEGKLPMPPTLTASDSEEIELIGRSITEAWSAWSEKPYDRKDLVNHLRDRLAKRGFHIVRNGGMGE